MTYRHIQIRRLGALLLPLFLGASCGYALAGRGNALPASIKVIGVPSCTNLSTTPEIDLAFTDAIRAEFQTKGGYTVAPQDASVDAVFACTVLDVSLRPTAFTPERLPSAYALVVTASIEFKHLQDANTTLWANPTFRVMDEYQITTDTTLTDVTTFFSQNANAQERLARRFARDVVTAVFEAF